MPNTYTLISSNVLSSTTASVTFSSIPATYTDLVLRISARTNDTDANFNKLIIRPQSSFGTPYSTTFVRGDGASASSGRTSSSDEIGIDFALDDNGNTSNTFGSIEVYIPNYTASTSKPMSIFSVSEENATTAYVEATAALSTVTAAISTVAISNQSYYFGSGSSFYLYGIKNS